MERQRISLDRYTGCLLTAIAGLLSIIAVELWVGLSDGNQAQAQIPDTGMQRKQIVDEARRTNELLEKILNHLQTGSVKVKLENADKTGGKKGGGGSR
jgi:hypothetical protein